MVRISGATSLPSGPGGQGSPWFAKFQSYKTGLDTVASSSLQSDCFVLVPKLAELIKAREGGDSVPEFASQNAGLANGFSTVLVHAIERHIIDQKATVAAAYLANFVTVFSTPGFLSEGDWEATPILVNAAGIMILDPTAVVALLKMQPWQQANRFLGGATAAQSFARYAAAGDGLAVLKTKFSANSSTVTAKWNELAESVALQQKPPEQ